MRKVTTLILSVILVSTVLSLAFAEKSPPSIDKTAQDRLAFNKETTEKMKADATYRKEAWEKSFDLMKKISDLNRKRLSTKDDAERKKLTDEASVLQAQLDKLHLEIAERDVASAEFSIKLAQDRLERAKKRLADIQAKKK